MSMCDSLRYINNALLLQAIPTIAPLQSKSFLKSRPLHLALSKTAHVGRHLFSNKQNNIYHV